jgi:outer membrane protein OmpA-like peptidoglycan-associated protein
MTRRATQKPKVRWWIPAVGLLAVMILLTAGFAWTIGRAVHGHAADALDDAGIDGVTIENSYRDVTLTGPAALEAAAVSAVEGARLVQDVAYVGSGGPEPSPTPTPEPSPSPTPTAEPSPSTDPSPTTEPTDTCAAISPECMGGVEYLAYVLSNSDNSTFAFGSAALTASDREILDGVAQAILESLPYDPDIRVLVAGHADSTGPSDFNQGLSERRARAVRDYLVGQGVPTVTLSIVGYGETQPTATNDTAAGRASNRRVELAIVED